MQHISSSGRFVFGINALFNFHSKRMEHYLSLVDKSADIELVLLFNKYASHSREFSLSLSRLLGDHGDSILLPRRSNAQGSIIKQLLETFNVVGRNEVLNHCEEIEREGLKIYRVALSLSFLPAILHSEVHRQKENMEEAVRTFIMMRQNRIEEQQVNNTL